MREDNIYNTLLDDYNSSVCNAIAVFETFKKIVRKGQNIVALVYVEGNKVFSKFCIAPSNETKQIIVDKCIEAPSINASAFVADDSLKVVNCIQDHYKLIALQDDYYS